MGELSIGQKNVNIGDALVGGPMVLFECSTKSFGDVKLVKTNQNTFEVTINGVTEKVLVPNKIGHA